jgi:shikimate kinase
MKYQNIVLIGMPASGKTFVGKDLADKIGWGYIDTDKGIAKNAGKPFFQVFKEAGEKNFLKLEEEYAIDLNLKKHVISPGGSIIFSPEAIDHLKKDGIIIYLQCSYNTIKERLRNESLWERTVIGSKKMTLKEIYDLRVLLYKKYADKTFNADGNLKYLADMIITDLNLTSKKPY